METIEDEPSHSLERRRRLHQLVRATQRAQRDVLLQCCGLSRRVGSQQFNSEALLCLDLVSRSLLELQARRRSLLSWSRDRAVELTLLAVHTTGQVIASVIRRLLKASRVHARTIAAERLTELSHSTPFRRGYRHHFSLIRPPVRGAAVRFGNNLVATFFEPLIEQLSPFKVGVLKLLITFVWSSLISGILDGIIIAQLPFDQEGVNALADLIGALSSDWFPSIKRRYQIDTLLVERSEWNRVRGVLACLSGDDARARAFGLGDEEAVKWRALLRPRTFRTLLECWRARNTIFVEPDMNSLVL